MRFPFPIRILLQLIINISSVLLDESCGTAFKSYNYGICAYLSSNKMTYCDAINSCAKDNGRLVSNYDNLVTILLAESDVSKKNSSYYIGISVLVKRINQTTKKVIWDGSPEDFIAVSSEFPNNNCAIYSFSFDNKETITGSACLDLNYYICEEAVFRKRKVFDPQPPAPDWINKYEIDKCAYNHSVDKMNADMSCALLCYNELSCRSFWYNENGDCKLSSLSYVVASFIDSQNWKLFTTSEESKKNKQWTTFIRRISDSVRFDGGWSAYKSGFGDVNGNFWLGLDKMNQLTQINSVARIYFTDWDNSLYYLEYSNFKIGDEKFNYTISFAGSKGTLCDGISTKGMQFSTRDVDNDIYGTNCATIYANSGWWYSGCHGGILTGYYYSKEQVFSNSSIPYASGITFACFNSKNYFYSVKSVEGKILTNIAN